MSTNQAQNSSKTLAGVLAGVSTIVFVSILIIVQLISLKHNLRFDTTENKRFSLSPQSLKILESLDKEIKAYCFYNPDESDYETVKDLLEQYKNASPKFTYSFVDLDKDPILSKTFDVKSYATTVLVYETQNRKVTNATEKDFANTILKLTRGDAKKKVYFITAHGEKDIESMEAQGLAGVKLNLQEANYEVEGLNLLKEKEVPADAVVTVIAGPQQDPTESEFEALKRYVENGGNLVVFIDPQTVPKLVTFLKSYKIDIGDDIVLDPKGFQSALNPIVEDYPTHEITKDFDYGTIFQMARSISPMEPEAPGNSVMSLVRTSDESWAETRLSDLETQEPVYDEGIDKKGPVSIAVIAQVKVTKPAEDSENADSDDAGESSAKKDGDKDFQTGKIIVFGDSEFVDNLFVSTFPSNASLALNTFHWLAEERDLIAIPPKETKSQPMHLSTAQMALAFWIPVVLIPLLILAFGGVRIYERSRGR